MARFRVDRQPASKPGILKGRRVACPVCGRMRTNQASKPQQGALPTFRTLSVQFK
jgi:hypothetical protein